MNTNMTGFRWFSKVFVASALEGLKEMSRGIEDFNGDVKGNT